MLFSSKSNIYEWTQLASFNKYIKVSNKVSKVFEFNLTELFVIFKIVDI